MNCKPGDMAVVVGGSKYAGKLVEVLYAAPAHAFRLPDGTSHLGVSPGSWVLRAIGEPFDVFYQFDGETLADRNMYGVGPDAKLRPIRGDESPESVSSDEVIREGAPA